MTKSKCAALIAIDKNGTPLNNKDKHFANQTQAVYDSFLDCPKTMLEASLETGILRANICRYFGNMREEDQIVVVSYVLFPNSISHEKAGLHH